MADVKTENECEAAKKVIEKIIKDVARNACAEDRPDKLKMLLGSTPEPEPGRLFISVCYGTVSARIWLYFLTNEPDYFYLPTNIPFISSRESENRVYILIENAEALTKILGALNGYLFAKYGVHNNSHFISGMFRIPLNTP